MAVTDLWHRADRAPCPACRTRTAGTPTARHGRGLRWRVTVGDHPTRAFAIKADAEAWERHLRDAPPITDTISGLLDRWEAGKADLEPTSRAPIRLAAQRVRDRWGVLSPDQVERSAITAWLANLTAEHGPKRARVVKPAAHSTKIKALQALAGALDIAVDRGLIRANPARGIRIARDDRREAVVLDVGDVARLAARVTGYEPLVWLLATSGLRIGEAVRLNVGDVDHARGRVRVRKAKARRGRDVPVPAAVLAMLPTDGRDPVEPLFQSPRGARLSAHNWRVRHLIPALESLGLEGMWTHDLRHTAATMMIDDGASIKTVQAALGHKDAATTLDVYADRFDHRLDDVARRMDRRIARKVLPRGVPGRAD